MKKDKTKGTGYSMKYLSIVLIILLSGSFLYWLSVHCGINQTYDSAAYIRLAETGRITSASSSNPWPPLFGFVLFTLHFKLHMSFAVIQFVFMVTNFLLLWTIGTRAIPDAMTRLIWLAASFLAVSFLMVHVFLWSEPLFMVIFLSMIIFIDRYIRKRRLSILLLLIIFSNLLCLQRNAGIFFVTGFAFSLAWFTDGPKRVLILVIFLVAGSISFIAWNLLLPGFRTGLTLLTNQSFFQGVFFNLSVFLNTISAWVLPRQFNSYVRIILLISGLIVLMSGKIFSRIYRDPELIILFIFIIYLTGISILGRIDEYESERYLAVIYPVAILPVLKRISSISGRIKFKARIIITILMLLWLSYVASRSVINAVRWEKASCSVNVIR